MSVWIPMMSRSLQRCESRLAIAALATVTIAATALAAPPRRAAALSPWEIALRARAEFEAEPASRHTHTGFARVMDKFRAIYHEDPAAVHAPRAVEQVAELLTEEGHQLADPKALHDAARQYKFLADQYPNPNLSPLALGQALDLLGPQGINEPKEAREIQTELLTRYPHSSAARAARLSIAIKPSRPPFGHPTGPADAQPAHPPTAAPSDLALLTGIRHWTTGGYTRVSLDLTDPANPDAVDRLTAHPQPLTAADRLVFELPAVRLAPALLDKTFTVTDSGLLATIQASQLASGGARIVLRVRRPSDYTAFLLPNPDRLIIDLRRKAPSLQQTPPSPSPEAQVATVDAPQPPAPRASAVEISSLPPMPATEGGATFASDHTPAPVLPVATATDPEPTGPPAHAATVPTPPPADHPSPPVVQAVRIGAPHAAPHAPPEPAPQPAETLTPSPVAAPQTTLLRALGLKIGRIVIDAGHGGHDSGTLGVDNIQEKDVVLDVALRLGKLLHERLGAEIVYTRSDDTFIPLETRTAIANKAQADLFISVHANSSPDPSARGVEVYYLNFTGDPDAMQVASRENAVSTQSVHDLSDLLKKIALKTKIDESRELAADVDASLYAGLARGNPGLKNRGVKKAPFVVLIGANMPSILAEISFVTNPADASQLQTEAYRQRVAESLYKGIARYAAAINNPAARPRPPVTERAAR